MGGIVIWDSGKLYFFMGNHLFYSYKKQPGKYGHGLKEAMAKLSAIKRIGPESFTKWID
jgi:hypothetical protein